MEGGKGSASHPGRFLPPGKTRYPLYRRLGGPKGRSGQVRKISPPTGIRSPDRQARSQSLYRLSYPSHCYQYNSCIFIHRVDTCNRTSDSRTYFIRKKTKAKMSGRNNCNRKIILCSALTTTLILRMVTLNQHNWNGMWTF
jgi:hypothetical protein